MGADYIEPDLVTTKDRVLVTRHEPEIGGTTDVANHPEFAGRKKTKHNTVFDGHYQIPTFQEVIDLSKRLSKELGRPIGIYPETKHPTYFQQQGLALEPELVKALNRNGLNRPDAKVFVQSFEVANLIALHQQLRVPLVQLTDEVG